jgi:peroxiredoxin
MKNRLIRLALFFFILLVPVTMVQADMKPGSAVPDFELTDMEGRKIKLSDYKGHPFILKLATTWCPSCKQQSAEFIKAKDFLIENKVPVIEVFVDDTEDEVSRYTQKYPLAGPHAIILDDGTVYKAYNVYLIPRVLVVDKNFKVKRDGSVIDAGVLKPMLQGLLN